MDGNKEDAFKCLKIGKEALHAGDRTRALKFVTKARRLDPTLRIDDLLSEIEKESDGKSSPDAHASSNKPPGSASSKPPHQPSLHQRVSSTGSSPSAATYTEEQIAIVRQIKKKKDYYEILGLEKSCSVEDIRKGYRKLSLKVHPDKNKAPGAEEAFKLVSKAFQCLGNEESRKKYDLVGSDEPVYERRPPRHAAHGFNGFYDADVNAEEIFRNFFFGGMAPTTQFQGFSFGNGMGPRAAEQGVGGFNIRALFQLLPVLLVLLFSFLPSSEPIYSLSRSHPYNYEITTPKGVNYYVKSTRFEQDYPFGSRERSGLDHSIEREYFYNLGQNCRLEIQRRQWGYIKETPFCNLLQKFESSGIMT